MQDNTQSLGDAIKAFLKSYRLEDKINEVKLKVACNNVLGPAISKHVEKISYRNGTLNISLRSAALKNELNYSKSLIIENINKEMQQNIVKQINIF